MQVKTVKQQHEEIDRLNREGDITVLKGIECDIQPDGSLDYPEEVLASFDFVIASVHTQMNIERKAMTERIRIAIRNPMTSILGHPTGRLLLSREGYAVDMDAVLDEALKNHVAIELNAHPWRLDLDWTLIDSFASSGGMIAIGPDAHETQGLSDMRYGILIARKGFLTPERCLNTFDADTVRGGLKRCR
jgi:DNA polymerase (family 10)